LSAINVASAVGSLTFLDSDLNVEEIVMESISSSIPA
jgi:hypothetical protein